MDVNDRVFTFQKLFLILIVVQFFYSCSQVKRGNAGDRISYAMERERTGLQTNRLLLNIPSSLGLLYSISGEGFDSPTAKDEPKEVAASTDVTYVVEGTYTLRLNLFQSDGTPFLEESLTWQYSTEIPAPPVVSFDEEASSDAFVNLVVSASRGEFVNELWVEGDLAVAPEGQWYDIDPTTGAVPVVLSDGQTLKTVIVKLRNDFGNDSVTDTLTIQREAAPPGSCVVETIADSTRTNAIQVKIFANDELPLYYRVTGDTEEADRWNAFTSAEALSIELTSGVGVKNLNFEVRDAAENACEEGVLTATVTVDPDYEPVTMEIAGNPIFVGVDDRQVILNLYYEAFSDDEPEMRITGLVDDAANTKDWVPFTPTPLVSLALNDGQRFVYVQFRNNRGESTDTLIDYTYLEPFVSLINTFSPPRLLFSNIIETDTITVTGCVETYNNVSYQVNLPCTVVGGPVTATYFFLDGTSTTVSTP